MSALYKCWTRWLLYIHWKTIGHKIKSGKILKHERTKNYKGHLSNNWIIFRSRSSLLLGFIGVHGFGPRPGVLTDFTRKKPGQLARNPHQKDDGFHSHLDYRLSLFIDDRHWDHSDNKFLVPTESYSIASVSIHWKRNDQTFRKSVGWFDTWTGYFDHVFSWRYDDMCVLMMFERQHLTMPTH